MIYNDKIDYNKLVRHAKGMREDYISIDASGLTEPVYRIVMYFEGDMGEIIKDCLLEDESNEKDT